MDQRGYIIKVNNDNTAVFKMQRMSACASCGKCFGSKSSESKEIEVEVDNSIGAKLGDYVEVSMEHVNVLRALGITYGFPLIMLMVGMIGGNYILKAMNFSGNIEVFSFIAGMITMAIAFLILKLNDKNVRESRKYMPVITNIVEEAIVVPGRPIHL